MPLTLNDQKELFSIAYVRAIAAVAACNHSKPELDRESIDLHITGFDATGIPIQLDVQLKCTADNTYKSNTSISYDLKQKNYNDLCAVVSVPRILIVMIVPDDLGDWLEQSEDQ